MFLNHSILNRTDEYIQNNLVELHIYLNQNNIQTILEQPAYELSALASDLGGVSKKSVHLRLRCRSDYGMTLISSSGFYSEMMRGIAIFPSRAHYSLVIGLYLGLTVVSAVEIFETVCLLIYVGLMRLRGLNIQVRKIKVCLFVSIFNKLFFIPVFTGI
jgi:ABC-type proline/glycine betaine transport system permease subunit